LHKAIVLLYSKQWKLIFNKNCMQRAKMTKRKRISVIAVLQILFCGHSFFSFAQTTPSFKPHDVIDVGGGMKVEILKCRGEGPTEECDCIYYTEKRQTGKRMWQMVSTIKEEERAALLAKKAEEVEKKPIVVVNSSSSSTNNSSTVSTNKALDKSANNNGSGQERFGGNINRTTTIATENKPATIEKKQPERPTTAPPAAAPAAPKATAKVSLGEAARQADSIAKAHSTLEETPTSAEVDSAEMDKVYIPRITSNGESTLEASVSKAATDSLSHHDSVSVAKAGNPQPSGASDVTSPSVTGKNVVDTTAPFLKPDTAPASNLDSIKTVAGTTAASTANNSSATKNSVSENTVAVTDTASAIVPIISATTVNVLGKSAEVNVNGEWRKATIVDKESEYLFKVHYLGKGSENDEWVASSQIRNIDTTSSVSTNPVTTVKKVDINCSFTAPAPPVSNAAQFSDRLAKRKIYESYLYNSKTTPRPRIGITFIELQTEESYVNSVSISSTNKLEVKLPIAPTGAMIYPVDAEYKLCEQAAGKTSSKIVKTNFACFRNRRGAWTCAELK
jgi:hypothetical protein